MRLGPLDAAAWHAAVERTAATAGAPTVLWAEALAPVPLVTARLYRVADCPSAGDRIVALVAPCADAPGRTARWPAWGTAPAVACCRQLGLHAVYEDGSIRFYGARRLPVRARRLYGCAVVEAALPALLFAARPWDPLRASRAEIRARLGLAAADWPDAPGGERLVESVFRSRLSAQYGWEFDHGWPGASGAASPQAARQVRAAA